MCFSPSFLYLNNTFGSLTYAASLLTDPVAWLSRHQFYLALSVLLRLKIAEIAPLARMQTEQWALALTTRHDAAIITQLPHWWYPCYTKNHTDENEILANLTTNSIYDGTLGRLADWLLVDLAVADVVDFWTTIAPAHALCLDGWCGASLWVSWFPFPTCVAPVISLLSCCAHRFH